MIAAQSGETSFAWLREALEGHRDGNSFTCIDIPYERLRRALSDAALSSTDRLVRLRHALRYASIHSSSSGQARALPVGRLFPKGVPSDLFQYGLKKRPGDWIEALPWRPSWLDAMESDGVDAFAMGEHERPWRNAGIQSDPWVHKQFGLETYRGPGQAVAVRSALHMPPGRTLIVLLPTGEGKSLVFQALAVANPGKTVLVIVPTVTLAQDHAASALQLGNLGHHEFAYLGGAEASNKAIRERILDGTQRLVFAAPEAVVTSLRGSLLESARQGRLKAIVVDEAHLVDAWGTDFRCEFQMLSGLAAQLRKEAPQSCVLDVICLSATVTSMAFETLRALFSPEATPGIAGTPRLRPEPDIWIDREWTDLATRQSRVFEAIKHLPRPAILYVTQPSEAEDWYTRLREAGFARVARVHGNTTTAQKEAVVKQWRSGDLDLVVGTSAFGLGIDYPHVRSIVHACLPESIDRYYQEVGRAGRDNRACTVLLIPAWQDKAVAKSQSDSTLISVAKGLVRWISMFEKKIRPESNALRYIVDLRIPPAYDQDMRSGRNEDWNAQVLNLMARAGLIRLVGLPSDALDGKSVELEVLEETHSDVEVWNRTVEPLRQLIQATNFRGFNRMLEIVNSHNCPRTFFAEAYELQTSAGMIEVAEACGGCEVCRQQSPGWFARWPHPPHPPWPVGRFDAQRFDFLASGVLFAERHERTGSRTERRQLRELLDALWNAGWRKCIVVGQVDDTFIEHLSIQPWCVAQGTDSRILAANGLPDGPELVWIGQSTHLLPNHVEQSVPGCERIYLIPHGCDDPRNPGSALIERRAVRQIHEILNWISQ